MRHTGSVKPTILMTGHTMPELAERKGDFDAWFARRFGWPVHRFRVVDAVGGEALPPAGSVDGLVISGSAHCVHDYPDWSVRAGAWIAEVIALGIPTLGVCYGHQLIGDVLGGEVGLNPLGREMGVCPVKQHGDDPLFEGLPREFAVIQTHVDAVNTLPPGRLRSRPARSPTFRRWPSKTMCAPFNGIQNSMPRSFGITSPSGRKLSIPKWARVRRSACSMR